jgi:hypothetical protein
MKNIKTICYNKPKGIEQYDKIFLDDYKSK